MHSILSCPAYIWYNIKNNPYIRHDFEYFKVQFKVPLFWMKSIWNLKNDNPYFPITTFPLKPKSNPRPVNTPQPQSQPKKKNQLPESLKNRMSQLNSSLKGSFFSGGINIGGGDSPFGSMFDSAFGRNPFQMRQQKTGSTVSNREISGLMKAMNVKENDMNILNDITSPSFGKK